MSCEPYENNMMLEWYQGDDQEVFGSLWSPDVSVWTTWDGYFQAREMDDDALIVDTSIGCTDSSAWNFVIPGTDTEDINGGDYTYTFYIQQQGTGKIRTILQDRLIIIDSGRV